MAAEDTPQALTLTPAQERYVVHWGQMGPRWGVNRTVAQIHALLYLVGEPQDADTIAATLGVARSNVSTSLRELRDWGLVEGVAMLGQRKEHFKADGDPWATMLQVMDERMKREIEPTLEVVRACVEEAKAHKDPKASMARMADIADLLESFLLFYRQMRSLPQSGLRSLFKNTGKLLKLVKLGS